MVTCMATKRVTVSLPEELLEEIRAEAAERGLSAYVVEALRSKRDRDRLRELLGRHQEKHSPVTDDERAEVLQELADLDAEHERRPATSRDL
jgi:metal-responsive CopG/Arc/MetJ family transcriptional regulator